MTELNTGTECENVKQKLNHDKIQDMTESNTRFMNNRFIQQRSKDESNLKSNNDITTLENLDNIDSNNKNSFIQQRSEDESKVELCDSISIVPDVVLSEGRGGEWMSGGGGGGDVVLSGGGGGGDVVLSGEGGGEWMSGGGGDGDVVLSGGGGGGDAVLSGEGGGEWMSGGGGGGDKEWCVLRQETSDDILTPARDTTQVDVLAPELRPTFNLAAYVNKSYSLQQCVNLGVDLSKWDKMKGVANFILTRDFDTHIKPYIMLLTDCGVVIDDLGRWLTINPYIVKEQLTNLQARVEYLTHMSFTKEQITRIISRNPRWLLYSTVHIDSRLGFYQRTFRLTGGEVRTLATREPRLITAKLYDVKRTTFTVLEEMGFSHSEMKTLLLTKPKIWLTHGVSLLRRFTYVHNTMGLTHAQLLHFPHVLLSRDFRLRQRHSFLRSIGRAQYDPTQPGYVSPQQLVSGDDVTFCSTLANTSIQHYNDFLKTM
ncbi:hypothetical protein Pmani_004022 [Petrolisthes manimaculis]|uniref:mTERF domain-containing protein 1, mitochondrial n=1 Tax=Petrolisthes manimaculis TaxID=1843537 RepID=A0AAE1UIY0_9EUCA|nr:hypothetical protein Pmani_004022 [Petrolisthes manimaculis]